MPTEHVGSRIWNKQLDMFTPLRLIHRRTTYTKVPSTSYFGVTFYFYSSRKLEYFVEQHDI